MPRFQIEILPGLSERFTPEHRGRLVLEGQMEENATLKDVLNEFAVTCETFGRVLFDLQSQRLYPNVRLAINNRLLVPLQELDVRVGDGDRITFLPAFAGG